MHVEPICTGKDERTPGEKRAWELLGPPLYYCSECLRKVDIKERGIVSRRCDHHTAQIIAPRRSILAGKGGLSFTNKVRMAGFQLGAALTGRCV